MAAVLFLHASPLASFNPWVVGTLGLGLFVAVFALLLSKPFTLVVVGQVLACALGVAAARLLFISKLESATSLALMLVCAVPALFGIYRLFVRDRVRTLEYFGY